MKAPPFGGVFLWVILTLVRITRVNSKLGNKTASNSEMLVTKICKYVTLSIHRKPKYLVNVITELKIIEKKFALIKKFFLYLGITKNKTMKNLVKTRKQLEAQGIAEIETNDWWQYDDAKWVLVLNDDYVEQGYVFKETKTTMWADLTVSRLVEIYNNGIIKQ